MRRGKTRWFLPENGDVLALLERQIEVTGDGMAAFARWGSGGGDAEREAVRDAEHAADERKRELLAVVRESFTTPLDPEDLFELSRGLDDVINGAKNAVREAEALDLTPDAAAAQMCVQLAEGVGHLHGAFRALTRDAARATDEAAAAIKSQRNLERTYRAAMSDLIGGDELRAILGQQELYRRLTRISDAIVAVADRVMYATVKEA